jgi:hypothetical protein
MCTASLARISRSINSGADDGDAPRAGAGDQTSYRDGPRTLRELLLKLGVRAVASVRRTVLYLNESARLRFPLLCPMEQADKPLQQIPRAPRLMARCCQSSICWSSRTGTLPRRRERFFGEPDLMGECLSSRTNFGTRNAFLFYLNRDFLWTIETKRYIRIN